MIKHIERTHKQGSKDKFVFLTHTFYRWEVARYIWFGHSSMRIGTNLHCKVDADLDRYGTVFSR